jgi:hypothetical protein
VLVNSVEFLLLPVVTAVNKASPGGVTVRAQVIEAQHFMSTWPGDPAIIVKAKEQLTVLRLNDAITATRKPSPEASERVQAQMDEVLDKN